MVALGNTQSRPASPTQDSEMLQGSELNHASQQTFHIIPTNKNKPEPGDVLYDPLLDRPELVLIKQTLTGVENYAQWARDFRRALIVKDKIGFIDGTILIPSKPNLMCFWTRCNTLVRAWISNSVFVEVAAGLPPTEDAGELWAYIKDMYDTLDLTKIYTIRQNLAGIRQGNQSMTSYFNQLSAAWNELDAVKELIVALLETLRQIQRVKDRERLTRFLMGLNEGFVAFST
ncbi:uncharacterized protein LOC123207101 [Mangifera indica]|uniref:uncharacterized protein LOC123207101 n=1 Tax=Mangifera indica TaxID=29780 RepID=UPI001CFB0A9D|nr:uncharacterized protein LOC123207101 [Mangifera indica]